MLGGLTIAFGPGMAQADLPHSGLTHTIIGTFFDTAKELGPGFSERVCQRSLQVALIDEGLQAEIDVPIRVLFPGTASRKVLRRSRRQRDRACRSENRYEH